MKARRPALVAACTLLAALSAAAPASAGVTIFGLTGNDHLVKFDSAAPGTILNDFLITGVGQGQVLPTLEVGPDGKLYLMSHAQDNALRLYNLDPATGQATLLPGNPGMVGPGMFGLDFNTVENNLRFVSDQDVDPNNNLRINPSSGDRVATDTRLNVFGIGGVAHTNPVPGATSTTLFGIDYSQDRLVRIGNPSPNDGTVTGIGALGVDARQPAVGFDIASGGTALAALTVNGATSSLYTIDLSTGTATLVGPIGNNLLIFGIGTMPEPQQAPPPPPPPQPPTFEIFTGPLDVGGPLRVFGGDGNDILQIGRRTLGSQFGGGVFVAAGDVNGDGVDDIVAGADDSRRGGGQVRVFGADGSDIFSFRPYGRGFHGGVRVAAGDVNGDGKDDIITGPGPGSRPQVKVFDGTDGDLLDSFFAFRRSFEGGVTVATGDVNGDGRADIITGSGFGGRAQVRVFQFDSTRPMESFFAYDRGFLGGIFVAAGDVNGDGRADVITGPGEGPNRPVRIFDGDGDALGGFRPFGRRGFGGVTVAAGDLDGDGDVDVVAGEGDDRRVKVAENESPRPADRAVFSFDFFNAYTRRFEGGVTVATGNLTP